MSHPTGATNLSQILASEARLSRLHRLFKTHFNVTEPSLILEPYLFLGNCISAHDTIRLEKLGIRYILNVAIRDVELCPYYSNDIRALTIDLRDDDRENILRVFDQAFAFIDEAKRTKSRVLVHCSHGQSRSPAIVIGYLMRSYNVSLEQCLTHVVKARPCVLPNDGFLRQLILYDRFLIERRQQQQKAALMKVVNAAPPTEIPIQHSAPQPPAAPVETANMSSIDSSSLGQTSLSSIQSTTSADSIHVVPIQISSNVPRPEKVASISIKKVPIADAPVTQETKKNVEKSKEKFFLTDLATVPNKSNVQITSSKHAAPSKKRQSGLATEVVKRSHSAYFDHTKVSSNDSTPLLSTEQWNVITYYPTSKDQTRTKYITEIYDKATNRFIPAS